MKNNMKKPPYLSPHIAFREIEMESHIAAGSITVEDNDNVVQESWTVEADDVRDIDLDFFN